MTHSKLFNGALHPRAFEVFTFMMHTKRLTQRCFIPKKILRIFEDVGPGNVRLAAFLIYARGFTHGGGESGEGGEYGEGEGGGWLKDYEVKALTVMHFLMKTANSQALKVRYRVIEKKIYTKAFRRVLMGR